MSEKRRRQFLFKTKVKNVHHNHYNLEQLCDKNVKYYKSILINESESDKQIYGIVLFEHGKTEHSFRKIMNFMEFNITILSTNKKLKTFIENFKGISIPYNTMILDGSVCTNEGIQDVSIYDSTICTNCDKVYSTKYALKKHQEKTKRCMSTNINNSALTGITQQQTQHQTQQPTHPLLQQDASTNDR